jgi:hypothetical protein
MTPPTRISRYTSRRNGQLRTRTSASGEPGDAWGQRIWRVGHCAVHESGESEECPAMGTASGGVAHAGACMTASR